MDRFHQKLMAFVEFAEKLAQLSTCKRAQRGAIVLASDLSEVLSIGYNGPSAGRPNGACTGGEGVCGCVHAEANAVAKLHVPRGSKLIMYCTSNPCMLCAGLIVNSKKVSGLLHRDRYRDSEGLTALAQGGVVTHMPDLGGSSSLDDWAHMGEEQVRWIKTFFSRCTA